MWSAEREREISERVVADVDVDVDVDEKDDERSRGLGVGRDASAMLNES